MATESSCIYVVKEGSKHYAYRYVDGREHLINLAKYLVDMVQQGCIAEVTKTTCESGREIATITFIQTNLKGIR